MTQGITLTQTYTGQPVTLETDRIRAIAEFVNDPGIFGMARYPGTPSRDFPVAWIRYEADDGTMVNYYTLQSADEVRAAIANGVGDLHTNSPATPRFIAYLKDLQEEGITFLPVYQQVGTPNARPGAWRHGTIADMPIAQLIANLEAGRPLATEGLNEWRAKQGRGAERAAEKLES